MNEKENGHRVIYIYAFTTINFVYAVAISHQQQKISMYMRLNHMHKIIRLNHKHTLRHIHKQVAACATVLDTHTALFRHINKKRVIFCVRYDINCVLNRIDKDGVARNIRQILNPIHLLDRNESKAKHNEQK